MNRRTAIDVMGGTSCRGDDQASGPVQVCHARGHAGGVGHRKRAQLRWDARVDSWEEQVESSAAFARVREAVLDRAAPRPGDRCVDLGAGSGFLTLPLAGRVQSVVAVDLAPQMLTRLASRAAAAGLQNVQTKVDDLTTTRFAASSLDLVVSSYALHSVPHRDKLALLRHAHQWLAPGGRIVVVDMMLGHGGSGRDRSIAAAKIRSLAARGPAGWWRAVRNTAQLGLGVGENRPASPDWWVAALQQSGFTQVCQTDVVAEAGLVTGVKPSAS